MASSRKTRINMANLGRGCKNTLSRRNLWTVSLEGFIKLYFKCTILLSDMLKVLSQNIHSSNIKYVYTI